MNVANKLMFCIFFFALVLDSYIGMRWFLNINISDKSLNNKIMIIYIIV